MDISKKYIQFNNLPFNSYNAIESADESGAYKYEPYSLTYGNGSYAPLKNNTMFAESKNLSITISIDTKNLRCDIDNEYHDFILHNLIQPGKIWCIVGRQIMWAHAFLVNKGEPYTSNRTYFTLDLEFFLPEGVWHRVDTHNLFIVPFDLCNFLDCEDYSTIDKCKQLTRQCCGECGKDNDILTECEKCGCGCSGIDVEYSYCSMKKEAIEQFHLRCGIGYRLIYDCGLGNRINGENLGTKICKEDVCRSVIAGQFYSDTLLNTNRINLVIKGYVNSPSITINDNTWKINGEYNGSLIIDETGTIYYDKKGTCCKDNIVDNGNVTLPNGSGFEWNIHHGNNRIIIETNDCCHMSCVYIKIDSLVP